MNQLSDEMPTIQRLEVTVASGDALDVRRFLIKERISSLFEISLEVRSENPDLDFERVVGRPMRLLLRGGARRETERRFDGVCKDLRQTAAAPDGLSTYELTLVPALWLATQRRNHRIYQHLSEIDIATAVLGEWGIEPLVQLTREYKKRKYRVQYGESDYSFLSRLLEDAGVSFYFETGGVETRLVLSDAPNANDARAPIAYRDQPTVSEREHVTRVQVERRVRPGQYTVGDHDYRLPATYPLVASAKATSEVEARLERFHYAPGAFVYESTRGQDTPFADDHGKYRADEPAGAQLAERRLGAKRATARLVSFDTSAIDPAPGAVLSFLDHPRSELGPKRRLLVIASLLEGTHDTTWTHGCEAVSAEQPYHPPLSTPRPRVHGVESATVVGPPGEEIHTDEFGRVRVHFHWDREGAMDEHASCWIHVSQPWGGTGFGGSNLPRTGQEVIVDFLGGDPDRPVIVGRVFTNLQKTPYSLPENKTQSGWKSNSTGGGGGYNEMMFEDAVGQELLRMQAEKDLHKLVKNDEATKIGNDQTHDIGNDETRNVGNDRKRKVGNDETLEVDRDRKRKVGRDETVEVERDRTRKVSRNEDVTVGKNRTKQVGENEREIIGKNRSLVVGVSRSTQIGSIDSTIVGQSHVVMVAPPGEGAADGTSQVIQHDRIELRTPGGASILLEGGTITLTAVTIIAAASGDHTVKAGGDMKINGGPMVRINDP